MKAWRWYVSGNSCLVIVTTGKKGEWAGRHEDIAVMPNTEENRAKAQAMCEEHNAEEVA